jgi:shikimate kinase
LNPEPGTHFNIFLIGYRCTGKSSVGKILSEKTGWSFIDTDERLVSESGSSIKEIVETQGWETFRKVEHDILKQACLRDRQVVATGGGIVLNNANVNRMKNHGTLIWLKATPETIKKRMKLDQDTESFRPSLTAKGSFSEIEETLREREPIYRKASDFRIDTDHKQIDEICEIIIRQLKKRLVAHRSK